MSTPGHMDMGSTGRKRSAPVHADEQGLGKTVQAIALIVSEPPTLEDAACALAAAEREQSSAALHPESREARVARAAGAGVYLPGEVDEPGVLLLFDPALFARCACFHSHNAFSRLCKAQRGNAGPWLSIDDSIRRAADMRAQMIAMLSSKCMSVHAWVGALLCDTLLPPSTICYCAAGDEGKGPEKRSAEAAELSASAEGSATGSATAKKAKKAPIQYQPCGRGPRCTCAICKKAKAQQVSLCL